MSSSFKFPYSLALSTLLVLCLATCTLAQVPAKQTFKIVNQGPFGEFVNFVPTAEYDTTYRIITNEVYDFFTYPFRLCFYNATPDAYVLGIRAGIPDDDDLMRWVWDANRNRPVKENATLSFGRDGNLVLADADGTVVWQTNTANKGVTGIKLQPNGNLVLFDKKGKFIWQSFDFPVDTLLVGMSIRKNVNKLVSRTSSTDSSDGKYSLVLEDAGLNLFLDNSGKPLRYNGWPGNWGKKVVFVTEPYDWNTSPGAYQLVLHIYLDDVSPLPSRPDGIQVLNKINYNGTYTFFRLESDGNIKAYTYFDKAQFLRWSESFAFFSSYYEDICRLPSKCGSYGLCQNAQCVGCPTPKGIFGWTESCEPPKLKPCEAKLPKANYYKIVGAQHFLNGPRVHGETTGDGPMTVEACRDKCTNDCQCKGFIYKEDVSKCWLVPVLGTLSRDVNTSVAYIKYK